MLYIRRGARTTRWIFYSAHLATTTIENRSVVRRVRFPGSHVYRGVNKKARNIDFSKSHDDFANIYILLFFILWINWITTIRAPEVFCTRAPAIVATTLATTKNGIWYAACLRVALHTLSLSHSFFMLLSICRWIGWCNNCHALHQLLPVAEYNWAQLIGKWQCC